MKRIIISSALLLILLVVGWRYTPRHARERLLGFIGVVSQGDADGIKKIIGDMVLPEAPEERREALIGELKENLRELSARTSDEAGLTGAGDTHDPTLAAAATGELIAASESIVKELEAANDDKSVGGTIVERIVDRILPTAQCKE